MNHTVKKINNKNFKSYGWVIEYPSRSTQNKKENLFRVILMEDGKIGWRIAYLAVRERVINKLEQHVGSFETFEPISGKSLLFVANRKDPARIECFYLDKSVILKKGIWHGIVTLGQESEIKLTENANVKCNHWLLGFELNYKKTDFSYFR